MSEHLIKVQDEPCKVIATEKSKGVWTATGYYMGERITVNGNTEAAAVLAWHETARHRGG